MKSSDIGSIEDLLEPFISQVDYPLLVVTTGEDEPAGCLVGFATPCSIEPRRFIVCISKVNHTFSAVERSGALALHLLREDQIELASLFGEETGDMVAKFARCSWHPGTTGVPVLDDCAAWIEGSIIGRFDAGDHEAILVQPLDGGGEAVSRVLTTQRSPQFRPGHPAGN